MKGNLTQSPTSHDLPRPCLPCTLPHFVASMGKKWRYFEARRGKFALSFDKAMKRDRIHPKETPTPHTNPHPKNTMLVNITKAAKLAGIGRETLYKNYINKGRISTTRDGRNRPMVDTSEILRVFGRLYSEGDTPQDTPTERHNPTPDNTHTTPPELSAQLAQLQAENTQLRERLTEARERESEAKERESWQRGQIEKLTDTIKLLEAPRNTTPTPHTATPTQVERLKGFIDRVLGR